MLQDIMYLRTLKAARSAKNFWKEIFMLKSQLGGILYIFPPGPRGGVSIFSPKTQKCHVYFCTTKGGWGLKGPKSQKYVQMCIHVWTFVTYCCLFIIHLNYKLFFHNLVESTKYLQ